MSLPMRVDSRATARRAMTAVAMDLDELVVISIERSTVAHAWRSVIHMLRGAWRSMPCCGVSTCLPAASVFADVALPLTFIIAKESMRHSHRFAAFNLKWFFFGLVTVPVIAVVLSDKPRNRAELRSFVAGSRKARLLEQACEGAAAGRTGCEQGTGSLRYAVTRREVGSSVAKVIDSVVLLGAERLARALPSGRALVPESLSPDWAEPLPRRPMRGDPHFVR